MGSIGARQSESATLETAAARPARTALQPEYFSLQRLAAYSSLSVRTLRGYLHHADRPLPYYRVGGKILVNRSEFDAWMGGFRVAATSQVDALVSELLTELQ